MEVRYRSGPTKSWNKGRSTYHHSKTLILLENRFAEIDAEALWAKIMKFLSLRKAESESMTVFCSKAKELYNDINEKKQGGGTILEEDLLVGVIVNGVIR